MIPLRHHSRYGTLLVLSEIILVHSSDLHVDNDPHQSPYGADGTTGLRVVLEAARDVASDYILLVGYSRRF